MTYHGRCRVLDTTLDYGLIAVLIWTPLAFGIVYPCAYSLMEIHIFLLIAAWMARLMVGRCLPDACQAIAVPAFGEQARTLAPVQALLLACVHRVAHHDNSERLIGSTTFICLPVA